MSKVVLVYLIVEIRSSRITFYFLLLWIHRVQTVLPSYPISYTDCVTLENYLPSRTTRFTEVVVMVVRSKMKVKDIVFFKRRTSVSSLARNRQSC